MNLIIFSIVFIYTIFIEIEIEGKSQRPQIGEEVFIPANALHTVRNVGSKGNVWYYGYKNIV